mmetsp:Transcript_133888/g.317404  ORF Transcript_133888/g.317404 Transcript_133888/m.317404 type:complete len:139 (+) Transcript_133888:61-477(+)
MAAQVRSLVLRRFFSRGFTHTPLIIPVQRQVPQVRWFRASSPDLADLARRKRLLWHAKSRGWLELDVLMGTFVEKHVWDFDEAKLELLEEVLALENPDLFKWFTKQAQVPEELLNENEVMRLMMEWVKSDHTANFSIK